MAPGRAERRTSRGAISSRVPARILGQRRDGWESWKTSLVIRASQLSGSVSPWAYGVASSSNVIWLPGVRVLPLVLSLDHLLLPVIGRSPFLLDGKPNEFAVPHDAPERAVAKRVQGLLVRCHSTQDGLVLRVLGDVGLHRHLPYSAIARSRSAADTVLVFSRRGAAAV